MGENVFIRMNASIRKRISIGEYSAIGMGANVIKSM